jgi:hypothetical protein
VVFHLRSVLFAGKFGESLGATRQHLNAHTLLPCASAAAAGAARSLCAVAPNQDIGGINLPNLTILPVVTASRAPGTGKHDSDYGQAGGSTKFAEVALPYDADPCVAVFDRLTLVLM